MYFNEILYLLFAKWWNFQIESSDLFSSFSQYGYLINLTPFSFRKKQWNDILVIYHLQAESFSILFVALTNFALLCSTSRWKFQWQLYLQLRKNKFRDDKFSSIYFCRNMQLY